MQMIGHEQVVAHEPGDGVVLPEIMQGPLHGRLGEPARSSRGANRQEDTGGSVGCWMDALGWRATTRQILGIGHSDFLMGGDRLRKEELALAMQRQVGPGCRPAADARLQQWRRETPSAMMPVGSAVPLPTACGTDANNAPPATCRLSRAAHPAKGWKWPTPVNFRRRRAGRTAVAGSARQGCALERPPGEGTFPPGSRPAVVPCRRDAGSTLGRPHRRPSMRRGWPQGGRLIARQPMAGI